MAAGLPVLAHLMRRRDLPQRALPTIALLERARAESRRRMRLVDLLLLAARVLMIAALAAAVAGPFVSVGLAYGDGATMSVAIVLDDSMSMGRAEGGRTLAAMARARAEAVIEALPDGSEVAVVLAGEPVRVLASRTDDLTTAAALLGDVPEDSARGTDMPGAVARALRELSAARHDSRRLLVLSDAARHGLWEEVAWPEGGVHVDVERLGDEPAPNRWIVDAMTVPDPTTPGQASVRVELRSDTQGEQVPIVLLRDGRELARQQVTIRGGVGRAILHAPLVDEGDPSAVLSIDAEDALGTDNRRAVLLRSAASIRVLLVDGDPHPTRDRDELGYVVRALDAAPRTGGPIAYQIVDPDTFAATSLADFDVVVLANAPAPPSHAADGLRAFVEAGGGLLSAVGDRVEPQPWEARLGELLPARLRSSVPADPPLALQVAPGAAVILAGDSGLEGAVAHRRMVLDEPAPGARIELRFEDGSPALVVGGHGAGRTALLSTTLDDGWTDLPYRPGFLPLLVQLLRHLSPRASTPAGPIEPGAAVTLSPPAGTSGFEVIDPGGVHHRHEGTEPLAFTETGSAGVYRVIVGARSDTPAEDPRSAFVVAPPVDESDLAVAPPPELLGVAPERGTGATQELPLAPWLFALVALLAVVEALLRITRPRARRQEAPTIA